MSSILCKFEQSLQKASHKKKKAMHKLIFCDWNDLGIFSSQRR